MKKQVVGDGKIVVSEKVYVRQQAELASYRKSKKRNTVKEQNAEALAPFKSDLEKIKEMICDVDETEAENRSEAGLPPLEEFSAMLLKSAESSDDSGDEAAAEVEEAATTEGTDVTEIAAAAQDETAEVARLRAQVQQLSEQAHRDRVISQGLLDAQPGLAAAATRRNQEDAAVTKVAAAAAEDVRLQREMIAGLQLKITELNSTTVRLREQLNAEKAQLAAEKRKFRQFEADVEAAEMELRVELAAENTEWQREQLKSEVADRKAAAAELAAERRKSAELAAEVETAATELAAEERKSGRWERQTAKLQKQIAKMKEEKTELKKQVVGDGKLVVSEKIYTRQKAQLAMFAKLRKSDAVKEQNREAMVPYREDSAQIKEIAADLERQKTAEAGGTA